MVVDVVDVVEVQVDEAARVPASPPRRAAARASSLYSLLTLELSLLDQEHVWKWQVRRNCGWYRVHTYSLLRSTTLYRT